MDVNRRGTDGLAVRDAWPTIAGAALLFAVAGLVGFGAATSPDNCGELPGIARVGATFVCYVVAGAIFVAGVVATLATGRAAWLARAAALALALVVGVQLGVALAGEPRCDGVDRPIVPTPRPTAVAIRFIVGT